MKENRLGRMKMKKENHVAIFSSSYNEFYKEPYSVMKNNWFVEKLEALPEWSELKSKKKAANLHGYVIPLFQFFHAIGLSPYRIIYNEETQLCAKSAASILRKIVCAIIQLSVLINQFGHLRLIKDNHIYDAKTNFVTKLMISLFCFYHSSMFLIFWTKLDDIARILNQIQITSLDLAWCTKYAVPTKNKIRLYAWSWIFAYLLFVISNIVYRSDVPWPIISHKGFHPFFESSGRFGRKRLSYAVFAESLIDNSDEGPISEHAIYIFGALCTFHDVYLPFTWVFNNLILVLWAAAFNALYDLYFGSLKVGNQNALKDIKVFNGITCILNDFNDVYGYNILTGVLASICFISNTIWGLFTATGIEMDLIARSVQFLGFCVFLIKLLASSQVNQKATEIVTRIKLHLKREEAWAEDCFRTIGAMMSICYDLQSHSVGFRGMNFFTLTFSFVGTIFSAIVTYSIVVLQFNGDVLSHANNTSVLSSVYYY